MESLLLTVSLLLNLLFCFICGISYVCCCFYMSLKNKKNVVGKTIDVPYLNIGCISRLKFTQ